MPVIAFSTATERRPTLTEVFGVQPYRRDGSRLIEGKLQQTSTMEAALRLGRAAGRRAPLVRVYRVRGNVEADYWEDPVTVASFGDMANLRAGQ